MSSRINYLSSPQGTPPGTPPSSEKRESSDIPIIKSSSKKSLLERAQPPQTSSREGLASFFREQLRGRGLAVAPSNDRIRSAAFSSSSSLSTPPGTPPSSTRISPPTPRISPETPGLDYCFESWTPPPLEETTRTFITPPLKSESTKKRDPETRSASLNLTSPENKRVRLKEILLAQSQVKISSYQRALFFAENSVGACCKLLSDHPFFQEKRELSLERLGSGNFMDVYRVSSVYSLYEVENLDRVVRPDPRVVKFFHFKQKTVESTFINNLVSELKHYYWLKSCGIPVISYLNFDFLIKSNPELRQYLDNWMKAKDSKEECGLKRPDNSHKNIGKILKEEFDGFYCVPYIKKPFLDREVLNQLNDKMEQNPEFIASLKSTSHPIYQLQQMLRQLWELRIPIDLNIDNLRIQDKTVLLCDLLYDLEEDERNGFAPLIDRGLKHFATEGSALWIYLDPRSFSSH